MPKGRASIRTLLGLRTRDRRHFMRFDRSAKVCTWGRKKSHVLGRSSQAAALPKSSRLLEWVPGWKGAHSVFLTEHGKPHFVLHQQQMWKAQLHHGESSQVV